MTRLLLALILSLAMLAGGPVVSAQAAIDGEMSDAQAGEVYLDAICSANDQGDKFHRVIWRGRKTIPWAEVTRRLPEIKRLSRAYGVSNQRASRKLFNPPAAWPADVDGLVTKFADASAKYSYWLLAMGNASTAREWDRYWTRAKKVRFGTWSTEIRARLSLPPNGRGC
jgi:hypothetical protein